MDSPLDLITRGERELWIPPFPVLGDGGYAIWRSVTAHVSCTLLLGLRSMQPKGVLGLNPKGLVFFFETWREFIFLPIAASVVFCSSLMISTGYVMLVYSETGAASLVHLYNALLTQHPLITSDKLSSRGLNYIDW
ncbi:hypothetical protein L6164_027453 [Bauhinia variegata]|uniref:Uncharacterized protein n=1 Tax=Bauhinia variegata TaxID=167791 RepID=A0ACB9LUV6_BAUVA|nr:hypothetical protein L6164_027453 [Bauhinia variegata]